MNIKKIATAIVTIIAISVNSAYASILGNLGEGSSLNVGEGLDLYHNTFISDQSGVGLQTEYYSEYTPNADVVPVVVTGEDIYGKRNANEIIKYMKDNEMVPMLGINASFFSLQTGIPMGHVITDGRVTSKDNRTLPAIGFFSDGTAMINDLYIETVAKFGDDYLLEIPHINKYISKETQILTMFTPDFGDYTGTSTQTLNVILEGSENNVRIGEEFICTVSEIVTSEKPLKINDNQLILSVNTAGNQWAIALINNMTLGQEITIKTTANNDEWSNIYNGLASEGARLLNDGTIASGLEAGAAPRTAVGITDKGKIIFYVIDGRQQGYSYGIRQDTLAKRLKELGCVDAINLDGGGSTTMAGVYPGCDTSAIINSPSDGGLRRVTNFIFLKNISKATGKTNKVYIYPYSKSILSGSTLNLSVKTVDDNFYPTDSGKVIYSSNEYALIDENGKMTALGEGDIKVTAEVDGILEDATFKSYITPHDIKLYNNDNNTKLDIIDALPGDTLNLRLDAYYNGIKLYSTNDAYRWTVDNPDYTVDEKGILKVSQNAKKNATLSVKAGGMKKDFKVRIPNGDAQSYPHSEIEIKDDTLIINIGSDDGTIDIGSSCLKIDGNVISLEGCEVEKINNQHFVVKYELSKGFSEGYHKIYSETVLENGNTSINNLKITKTPYKNLFQDTDKHWARDTISYMNKMGVVNGSTVNGALSYRPNDTVTRAEFAVMVSNYLGFNSEDYSGVLLDAFADVSSIPGWASNSVKAVYANKIINGKDNNGLLYFDASANITRAEAITIISRILPDKLEAKETEYKDSNKIPEWAKKATQVLTSSGLINGYEDNTIRPDNSVTRAEAVTMLYNIY